MISFVRRLLRGERLPDPVLTPPNFLGPRLPAEDGPEERGDSGETAVAPLNRALILEYVDAEGEPSTRRVRLIEVVSRTNGNVYLRCFCLERRAPREFRMDRVEEVWCGVTGEQIEDFASVFTPTRQLPPRQPPSRRAPPVVPPIPDAVDLLAPVRAGLRVLMTIARADGRVHPAEEREIRSFITSGLGLGSANEEGLVMEAFYMSPSFEGFLDDCDQVFQAPHELGLRLLEHVGPLINADGTVHQAELEVLDDLMFIARANGIAVEARA